MKKNIALGAIAIFLIVAISLINFKLTGYIPKEMKTDEVKQIILWVNNFLGVAFFIDIAILGIDILKIVKEKK